MANMNKRDSDSKTHKTVINVRASLFSGKRQRHTCVHTAVLRAKSARRNTEVKGEQSTFSSAERTGNKEPKTEIHRGLIKFSRI